MGEIRGALWEGFDVPHSALTACSALDRAVLNVCCLKQRVLQQEPNCCMLKKSQ